MHHKLYIIFNVFLYSFVVFLVNGKIKRMNGIKGLKGALSIACCSNLPLNSLRTRVPYEFPLQFREFAMF